MTAFLALRHTSPPGVLPSIFASITKARLITKYPHAGIVIDGILYDATFKHGVNCCPFHGEGWELYKISSVQKDLMIDRFNQVKGNKYDWFSLLAFILPFRVSMGKWFYCYELCSFMLDGSIPVERITPETLLTKI